MHPGEIFVLPRDEYHGGDPKDRAHVALSIRSESSDLVTLAFCSTSEVEAAFEAPHIVLEPDSPTFKITGLEERTFVYPSRLVTEEYLRLGEPIGRVVDEMPQLRDVLRRAVGIGTGTATMKGAALGSLRGQIVLLGRTLADELGTRHAIVVADPRYSRASRFVNVIPLFDLEEFEAADVDVVLADPAWAPRIGRSGGVLVCISAICSCFVKDSEMFDSQLGIVVTEPDIAAIDRALTLHFFGDKQG